LLTVVSGLQTEKVLEMLSFATILIYARKNGNSLEVDYKNTTTSVKIPALVTQSRITHGAIKARLLFAPLKLW